MTTSWAYATRGQMADALRAHVGGTLLAVAAAIAAATTLAAALRGKPTARMPSETAIISLVAVGTALLLAEWIVRLWAD